MGTDASLSSPHARVDLAPVPARDPPSLVAGLLVAVVSVAVITALINPLREISPAEASGVAYLLAVLLVATLWGLRLGLRTSVLSAAAFG